MVLQAGQVSLSPIQWESVSSGTHKCTLERVPRCRVASATAELQKQVDRAVESKDYELAASLQRKLDSAEPAAPVETDVWRKAYLQQLPSVVTWICSLPRGLRLAYGAGCCPSATEARHITGENCCTIAKGTWSKIVAAEEEARADQLQAAESLVKQILTRAAYLGHCKVGISPIAIQSGGPTLYTWTVHQEMAPALFTTRSRWEGRGNGGRDNGSSEPATEPGGYGSLSFPFQRDVVAKSAMSTSRWKGRDSEPYPPGSDATAKMQMWLHLFSMLLKGRSYILRREKG